MSYPHRSHGHVLCPKQYWISCFNSIGDLLKVIPASDCYIQGRRICQGGQPVASAFASIFGNVTIVCRVAHTLFLGTCTGFIKVGQRYEANRFD